jgi:hypothetical protein
MQLIDENKAPPDAHYEALCDAFLETEALSHAVLLSRLSQVTSLISAHEEAFPASRDNQFGVTQFLEFKAKYSRRDAKEFVRVSVALQSLPLTLSSFEDGVLSFAEVRQMTHFFTPENEAELLEAFRFVSLNGLRERALAAQLTSDDEPRPSEDNWARFSHRNGRRRMTVEGDEVFMDLIQSTLDNEADTESKTPTGEYRPVSYRRATALRSLCERRIADDADADRATVVIETDLDTFASREGVVTLNGRPTLFRDIADLACDMRYQVVGVCDGVTVGISRTSRDIPSWLRRLLNKRDKGCRFPNCTQTKYTHGHHLIWWSEGGPTDLDNLISLCSYHHHVIHDLNWKILGDPNGQVDFVDTHGRIYTTEPPPMSNNTRKQINKILRSHKSTLRL